MCVCARVFVTVCVCVCVCVCHGMCVRIGSLMIGQYSRSVALSITVAASQGHLSVVEFLLQHQAEVNCTDRMGFTPLVDALRHEHVSIMKVLRSHGGQLLGMDVSEQLCSAAAAGDVLRIKALIENGANPDSPDYDLVKILKKESASSMI